MLTRRRFLRTVSVSLLAAPVAAEAQQAGKIARIGYLALNLAARDFRTQEAFFQGLRDLGYVERLEAAEIAARTLGVRLHVVEARGPEDFDRAFSEITRARAGALQVATTEHSREIARPRRGIVRPRSSASSRDQWRSGDLPPRPVGSSTRESYRRKPRNVHQGRSARSCW